MNGSLLGRLQLNLLKARYYSQLSKNSRYQGSVMRHTGTAKLDKRTKDLVKRLAPGDIAIIDHQDMDRVSAESLLETGVTVVINASASISGNYPNIGPLLLALGGVTIIDDVGPAIFEFVKEGDEIAVVGDTVLRGETPIAFGTELVIEDIERSMVEAKSNIGVQLDKFARNTLDYLENERDLLTEDVFVPEVRAKIEGRQVLVVVRGYDYKEDLQALRPYIREMKPLLFGVDGGADAIVEAGFTPDVIIGDMDSVSDAALLSSAELIVHAYEDGNAPGMERLEELGVSGRAVTWPLAATSEDLALLMAWEKGADLIVAVGTHANLMEYLDKGRRGMASSFLVRLRVGPKLVDAKGVNKLYRSDVSASHLAPVIFAALVVAAAVIFLSPSIQDQLSLLIIRLRLLSGL